jgi:hypothetical protein
MHNPMISTTFLIQKGMCTKITHKDTQKHFTKDTQKHSTFQEEPRLVRERVEIRLGQVRDALATSLRQRNDVWPAGGRCDGNTLRWPMLCSTTAGIRAVFFGAVEKRGNRWKLQANMVFFVFFLPGISGFVL